MFCHKIICKKQFIVKNFDRGHECILSMNISFFNIVLNTLLALISYTLQGLPLHPLESLRAKDLHTESFQSLRNPLDFLVERGF